MSKIGKFIGRHSGRLLFATMLTLAVLVLGTVRTSSGSAPIFAWLLLGLTVTVLVITLSASFAGVDPDARLFARHLATDHLSEQLLHRWFQRVRWRRILAGILGLIAGFFISSSVNQDVGSAAFAYIPLAAVAVASISAELHLLRRSENGPRVADLSVRSFGDFANATDQIVMAAVAAGGTTLWVASFFMADRRWVLTWSTVALVALALAHLMQRKVVDRSRPALPDELREADNLLRRLAISRGIARPAISLSLITLGVALLRPELDLLETIAWTLGIGWWWFNRGLGMHRFLKRRTANRSRAVEATASVQVPA